MEITKGVCLIVMMAGLIVGLNGYLEMKLNRIPHPSKLVIPDKAHCPDEKKINAQAQYKEVCYEKDISYSIEFYKDSLPYYISVDLTTPLSWIKSKDCHLEGNPKQSCHKVTQVPKETLQKVTKKIKSKLHMHQNADNQKIEIENAIIEGSSEVIRGEFQRSTNIMFQTRNSKRLENLADLLLLGLYFYGERDTMALTSTNFIDATSITQNLNYICDGAISFRFDEGSQNSFLNQIFDFIKSSQKVVTIYLDQNQTNVITIGQLTAKYSERGYSGITWVDLPEDEGFGKYAEITDIIIEDRDADKEEETKDTLPAVITLSASYIALPESVITESIIKSAKALASCKISQKTSFLECTSQNKKNIEKLLAKNLIFGLGKDSMMLSLADLMLKRQSKTVILNIKKSQNNRVILGEPLFAKYYMLFDYGKNRIGFSERRKVIDSGFINVVSLVHFLVFVLVFGCSFIICFRPCEKLFKIINGTSFVTVARGSQGKRLRQYSPIQENPYDDLKGKIQQAINSTEETAQ